MKSNDATFPLVNRAAVFLLSLSMFAGAVAAFVMPQNPGGLDLVNAILWIVFGLFGAGGLWLSLFWRPKTAEELALERVLPVPDRPEFGSDAIHYVGQVGLKTVEVILDWKSRAIHFRDCHVPRGFLTSAQPWFSCSVDELKGVHVFAHERSTTLTIVTAEGRAEIPSTGDGFPELHAELNELVPGTRPGFSADHPMMGVAYVAGAVVGLFAGVLLAPRGADDGTLGVCMLVGAFVGVVAVRLAVWVGDRYFNTGLTQPLGYGMYGAMGGVSVSAALPALVGWNLVWLVVPVVAGTVLGVLFGFVKQSREMVRDTDGAADPGKTS
ncbi:hypothetical protein Mal4_52170 [Maioricimonas rarisocia]|uniref:Bacterial Pleckstrin homology domain-containing protein n=2 Tax=Maioricimonas rarisocia TaxID=2528026 RepID=A0A517ZEH5_9PLAN|nr:hypothetical protein Mal4_52170 [Maioricimonas rarisocia]